MNPLGVGAAIIMSVIHQWIHPKKLLSLHCLTRPNIWFLSSVITILFFFIDLELFLVFHKRSPNWLNCIESNRFNRTIYNILESPEWTLINSSTKICSDAFSKVIKSILLATFCFVLFFCFWTISLAFYLSLSLYLIMV